MPPYPQKRLRKELGAPEMPEKRQKTRRGKRKPKGSMKATSDETVFNPIAEPPPNLATLPAEIILMIVNCLVEPEAGPEVECDTEEETPYRSVVTNRNLIPNAWQSWKTVLAAEAYDALPGSISFKIKRSKKSTSDIQDERSPQQAPSSVTTAVLTQDKEALPIPASGLGFVFARLRPLAATNRRLYDLVQGEIYLQCTVDEELGLELLRNTLARGELRAWSEIVEASEVPKIKLNLQKSDPNGKRDLCQTVMMALSQKLLKLAEAERIIKHLLECGLVVKLNDKEGELHYVIRQGLASLYHLFIRYIQIPDDDTNTELWDDLAKGFPVLIRKSCDAENLAVTTHLIDLVINIFTQESSPDTSRVCLLNCFSSISMDYVWSPSTSSIFQLKTSAVHILHETPRKTLQKYFRDFLLDLTLEYSAIDRRRSRVNRPTDQRSALFHLQLVLQHLPPSFNDETISRKLKRHHHSHHLPCTFLLFNAYNAFLALQAEQRALDKSRNSDHTELDYLSSRRGSCAELCNIDWALQVGGNLEDDIAGHCRGKWGVCKAGKHVALAVMQCRMLIEAGADLDHSLKVMETHWVGTVAFRPGEWDDFRRLLGALRGVKKGGMVRCVKKKKDGCKLK